MRALVKDPTQRWQTADEFMAALQAARAAIAMGGEGQGTAVWGPLPAPEELAGPKEGDEERSRRRWPWLLLPVLLGAAAVAALLLTRGPDQVAIPDLVGDPLAEATPALEDAGFEVAVDRQADAAPINQVIDQDPDAGLEAEEGSTVTLTVSSGPPLREVPDVVGEPRDKAVKELNDAGFEVDLQEQPSTEVAEGLVSRTLPSAGTERRGGSRIQVFVSSGPREVEVPNVIGSSRSAAVAQLRGEGLEASVEESPSDEPRGQVTAQSPSAGTSVREGTQVTITVSSGGGGSNRGAVQQDEPRQDEESRVPDVVGLSEAQAQSRLRAAGFGVSVREQEVDSQGDDGKVLRQSPSGGSDLRSGGTVTIVVGRFEEPPEEPGPGDGDGDGGGDGGPGGSLGGKRTS